MLELCNKHKLVHLTYRPIDQNKDSPLLQFHHKEIVDYFKSNDYFGLGEETIKFFAQESLPALDLNGKIIMEDKN